MAYANNSVRFFMSQSGRVRVIRPDIDTCSRIRREGVTDWSSVLHTSEMTLYNEYSGFCIAVAGVRAASRSKFLAMMKELQHELGFLHYVRTHGSGAQENVYLWLTLVNAKG